MQRDEAIALLLLMGASPATSHYSNYEIEIDGVFVLDVYLPKKPDYVNINVFGVRTLGGVRMEHLYKGRSFGAAMQITCAAYTKLKEESESDG